jgi:hypothetical protein
MPLRSCSATTWSLSSRHPLELGNHGLDLPDLARFSRTWKRFNRTAPSRDFDTNAYSPQRFGRPKASRPPIRVGGNLSFTSALIMLGDDLIRRKPEPLESADLRESAESLSRVF